MVDVKRAQQPRIIIVGAGLAGILTAVSIKKQLGYDNFTIYEKAAAIGGTWRDNTYPGCGSDVPGHWYSLSTELNPDWSAYFVTQPEIREYWERLYQKYDLQRFTVLNTAVASAEWDSTNQLYHVILQNAKTGEETLMDAEVIILAIGGLANPRYPDDVRGAENFKGLVWHSARWRHDIDLKGKSVAVIGNGCSAAQFIPEISEDPSVDVVNFCRTPQWFVPRFQYKYPRWIKWMFRHVPLVMRSYRNYLVGKADIGFFLFRKNNTRSLAFVRKRLIKYIEKMAPEEYHDKLIPQYSPGCKRLIVDPNYLKSLRRPNVHLNWDGIDEIVEEGIKNRKGDIIPFDVIIFGTGYTIEPDDLRVKGSKGTTIGEFFQSQGGPTSYLGTVTPGFPNLFTVFGPNVATGHASVIFTIECQAQYTLQVLKPILGGKAKSLEVTELANVEYNDWLQGRLADSVWVDCSSYYRQGGTGKNVATYPGPVLLFWWYARRPRWEHYTGVSADGYLRRRRWARGVENLSWLVLVLGIMFGMYFRVYYAMVRI